MADEKAVREVVALGLDQAAGLLDSMAGKHPLFAVAAGMTSAVASLVRSVGVQSAADEIADLVRRRDEGKITADDVRGSNDTIVDAVASLYREGSTKE